MKMIAQQAIVIGASIGGLLAARALADYYQQVKVHFLNWYISKLHVAARRDPVIAIASLKVTNLTASPKSLIHSIISLRVLLGNILQVGIPRVVNYKRNSNAQMYSNQL
ncbi:MAG: hypothetical protein V7K40_33435 [Nostoc sp.]|uniref:hypothetical protein n=1 Tax=Nostoc sp. TaxID=1180 RepID=UPI002FFAFAAD